jgi:hypothetical protein
MAMALPRRLQQSDRKQRFWPNGLLGFVEPSSGATDMRDRLSLLVILGVLSVSALAETYRWVDASGAAPYTQRPPPTEGRDVRQVAPPPPPGEAEKARTWLEDQRKADAEQRAVAEKSAAEGAKQAEIDAAKSRDCAAARHNLSAMQSENLNTTYAEGSGGYSKLTPDQRADIDAAAKKTI